LAGGPGGLPGGPGGLPGGLRRGWRGLPRGVLAGAAAAAVLLAALAGYGVFSLTRPGSSPGAASGPPHLARGAADRARKKTPASPSPSPAPTTVAQCLIGTWTDTGEDFSETFNGAPVTFTGGVGAIQIFEPNGINILEYNHTTYTTHLNGNTWTEVETGRASVHYAVQNGVLLSSNLSASGTVELLENGSYNNGAPMTLNMDPDNVTCSGNTLRLYATDGASVNLTRDVPKTPSGS
jgi:molecular chaperone DnaK